MRLLAALLASALRWRVGVQELVGLVPGLDVDDGRMDALADFALVVDLADVRVVVEHRVNLGVVPGDSLPGHDAVAVQLGCDLLG